MSNLKITLKISEFEVDSDQKKRKGRVMSSKRLQQVFGFLMFLVSTMLANQSFAGMPLNLAIEDMKSVAIKVEIKTKTGEVIKKIDDLRPGSADMALSKVPDGDYHVYFSSPGYATQWQRLKVNQEVGEPGSMNVKLFRKRYVVMHYVFNTSGGLKLSGSDIKEGRAAVAHLGQLPFFGEDWQIWQGSPGNDLFGDTPSLKFHRISDEGRFGFAKAPTGVAFDALKEIPANIKYSCDNMKAEKGLTLFCHVESGNDDGLGYGKVIVEDVTETPPAGVKVIEDLP